MARLSHVPPFLNLSVNETRGSNHNHSHHTIKYIHVCTSLWVEVMKKGLYFHSILAGSVTGGSAAHNVFVNMSLGGGRIPHTHHTCTCVWIFSRVLLPLCGVMKRGAAHMAPCARLAPFITRPNHQHFLSPQGNYPFTPPAWRPMGQGHTDDKC